MWPEVVTFRWPCSRPNPCLSCLCLCLSSRTNWSPSRPPFSCLNLHPVAPSCCSILVHAAYQRHAKRAKYGVRGTYGAKEHCATGYCGSVLLLVLLATTDYCHHHHHHHYHGAVLLCTTSSTTLRTALVLPRYYGVVILRSNCSWCYVVVLRTQDKQRLEKDTVHD